MVQENSYRGNDVPYSKNNSLDMLQDVLQRSMDGFDQFYTVEYQSFIHRQSKGLQTALDEQVTNGSGSISNASDNVGIELSTGSTASSDAMLGTLEWGRYIPGVVAMPSIGISPLSEPTGEQEWKAGYFNDDTGFGVGEDSTGRFTFIRIGGTDTKRRPGDWNGYSEDNFSRDQFSIYRMPFQFYGEGPVSFWHSYEGDETNELVLIDKIFSSVHGNDMFLEQPSLPLRAIVENGSTTSDLTLLVGGRSYGVFGDYQVDWNISGARRSGVTVGQSWTPLVSVRLKSSDYGIYSIPAAGTIFPVDAVDIQIFYRSDIQNASWGAPSELSASETALEYDTSADGFNSTGEGHFPARAPGGQGSRSGNSSVELPDISIPAVSDGVVTLAARKVDSGDTTVDAFVRMQEEIT